MGRRCLLALVLLASPVALSACVPSAPPKPSCAFASVGYVPSPGSYKYSVRVKVQGEPVNAPVQLYADDAPAAQTSANSSGNANFAFTWPVVIHTLRAVTLHAASCSYTWPT